MEKYLEVTVVEPAKQSYRRWFALSVVIGEILFTLAWLLLGFISPGFTIFGTEIKPYSVIATPISGLGLGVTAPFMNASFIVSGMLILVGVVGVFQSIPTVSNIGRWICIAIFGLSAVGMAMDGIFTLESFLPHMLGFLLAIGSLVIGFLVAGALLRRIPSWRRFANGLLLASPVTLMLLIISLATFQQEQVVAGLGIAGLTERILCLYVGAWLAALGWKAYRIS